MDEGELTLRRCYPHRAVGGIARELRLGGHPARPKEDAMGAERLALLCDAFEAMIGALYLDAGVDGVIRFMEPRFERSVLTALEDETILDPRSRLQMWAKSELSETPRYATVDSYGPDHAREFVVEVSLGDRPAGRGRGRSKQEAAQEAAADALTRLNGLSNLSLQGGAA
jgi:ribonuclease-3